MTASEQNPEEKRRAAERAVLQAMCQGTEEGSVWDEGMRLLRSYRFCDIHHQVVFEALQKILSAEPPSIREQLQQRVVLAGFPDLDAQEFFVPHSLGRQQALELIRWLAESA